MRELDPIVLLAVFQEMLGAPLLWLLIILCIVTPLAFITLLLRERRLVSSHMLYSQAAGLLGGGLALVLMARVSSSGFTDAGGPADWLLIGLIFGLGLIVTTLTLYSIAGWTQALRRSSQPPLSE
ncbi:DUF5368 family protein [Halopseudomonas sp. Lyrl_26]|uniref:DUF5368 family protein n=1 Tax=Halopseudomonas sp. Lyrl_26 TaxID=3110923 RepID=UPI003F80DC6F